MGLLQEGDQPKENLNKGVQTIVVDFEVARLIGLKRCRWSTHRPVVVTEPQPASTLPGPEAKPTKTAVT